jgi:putative transposase
LDGTWERIHAQFVRWERGVQVHQAVPSAASLNFQSDQQRTRLIFSRLAALPERMARLVLIWVDGTYEGVDFMQWTMDTYRWILETIKRSDNLKGFVLLTQS